MQRTFHIARQFAPTYSLLGRWIRHRTQDERRAEALFILALSGLVLGFVLLQFVTWTLLKPAILAEPQGSVAIAFGLGQIGAIGACLAVCVLGFKPPITVTYTTAGLRVQQGPRELAIMHDDITGVEPISALLFHRHYRRYAATQVFVNHIEEEVLLLRTARAPVVIGLAPADQAALLELLRREQPTERLVRPARVA